MGIEPRGKDNQRVRGSRQEAEIAPPSEISPAHDVAVSGIGKDARLIRLNDINERARRGPLDNGFC